MMSNGSQTMRSAAALGLLLMVLLAAWLYLLRPWYHWQQSQGQRIEQLQRQQTANRALLAREVEIDAQIERIEALGDGESLLLEGDKPAIAAAKLRELISEVVADSGGQLISVQEYRAEGLPGARAVGLRVHSTGEARNLQELLYALESSTPAIFVDKLTVSSSSRNRFLNQRRGRIRAPARAQTRAQTRASLDFRLDLTAYQGLGDS